MCALCKFFMTKNFNKMVTIAIILAFLFIFSYFFFVRLPSLNGFSCGQCGYFEDDTRFLKCEFGYARYHKGEESSYDHLGSVRKINVETDHLARRVYGIDQSANSNTLSIFSGCSFVFGVGLDADETLPYLFSNISRKRSMNLGTAGGGLHSVHRLVDLLTPDELGGDKEAIFYYVFISDHLNRWHRRASYLSWGLPVHPTYDIVKRHAAYAGPLCERFSFKVKEFFKAINLNNFGLKLLNMIYPMDKFSDEDLDNFAQGVVSLKQKISEKKPNFKFHFVFHPLTSPLHGNLYNLNEKLRKAGISTVHFNNFFPDHIDPKLLQLKDKHPSGLVNKLLAEWFIKFENK